jgi:NRAMP (natural resistance-associated macrophage protein)-like metal ion transporter
MGGFPNLKLKKWMTTLITRGCAIVLAIVVASFFDSLEALDVLNEWFSVLQPIHIPFALIPLITLVSMAQVMGVFKIDCNMQVSHHPFLFP